MMFNFWRNYPARKPKEDGLYLCTIDMGAGIHLVKLLWYNDRMDKWINRDRLSVFEAYAIYKLDRATIEENRVYVDDLCERTDDVIAWKMVPKAMTKKKPEKDCAKLPVW